MQEPHHLPSEFGSPIQHRLSVGARGVNTAGESHLSVPWKVNPPVFSGDSSDYLFFRKEALPFAEYVGFRDVFTILKTVPFGDTSRTTQQIRDMGYSNDEINIHRKACRLLKAKLD